MWGKEKNNVMKLSYFLIPAIKDRRHLSPEIVVKDVCRRYDLSVDDLKSECRKRDLVFPRHLAMYLIKQRTGLSLSKIGEMFNRDHTSVMHAIRTIQNYIDTDSLNKREEIIKFY